MAFPVLSFQYWPRWLVVYAAVAIATCIGLPFQASAHAENAMLLYLLGVIWLAGRYGWHTAILASLTSFLAYNFFFTVPYYSFAVDSPNDIASLFLFLSSGFLAGFHTSQLQEKRRFFERKEQETSALYAMARELATSPERIAMVEIIRRHITAAAPVTAMLWFRNEKGEPELATQDILHAELAEDAGIAWALEKGEAAGFGTATLPKTRALFLPLSGTSGTFGVLGLIPHIGNRTFTPQEILTLRTFASLAAAALERIYASRNAEARKVEAEGERLRTNLLSSVSHDLRTPLASIKGVIGNLLLGPAQEGHSALLRSAEKEVIRMERLIANLLDITRLESGVRLSQDYYYLPELVGNALAQLQNSLTSHPVQTHLDDDLPPLWVDGLLVEQLLVNLLENACKHTPAESTIRIIARVEQPGWLIFSVEDSGPGILDTMQERIFDKFITLTKAKHHKSTGLGLTICRAIAAAHGGNIVVTNATNGGARFTCRLPTALPALDDA